MNGKFCRDDITDASFQQRFFARLQQAPNGCLEWPGKQSSNRYSWVWVPARKSSFRAHRVAYEIAYGPIPDGLLVCHHCDNKRCCEPTHLFLGTYADNLHDLMAKGLFRYKPLRPLRGAENLMARLSTREVAEIRRRYLDGERQCHLAITYNVSPVTICNIVNYDTWKHVSPME